MRIGILGCGLLGLHLAKALEARGSLSLTTTQKARKEELSHYGASLFVLEGTQINLMREFLYPLDLLIMTMASKSPSDDRRTYQLTCRNIKNLLKEQPTLGPEQIIYTSSTHVYGNHEGERVLETAPLLSQTPHGEALIGAERELLEIEKLGRAVSILRLAQLYGPSRTLSSEIKRISGSTLSGKGNNFTNFTHLDDARDSILHIAEKSLTGIYNVVGETHMPRRQFYDLVCRHYSWPAPTWDQIEGVKDYRHNNIVDSQKIIETGFTFSHPQAFDWLNQKAS